MREGINEEGPLHKKVKLDHSSPSSSSSLTTIVQSIKTHLHSISQYSGIQNNNNNNNDNNNTNANNDFELEVELSKINDQLKELDHKIKSKNQYAHMVEQSMAIISNSNFVTSKMVLSLASTSHTIMKLSLVYSFSARGDFRFFKPVNLVDVSHPQVPSHVQSISMKEGVTEFPLHSIPPTVKKLKTSNSFNFLLDLLPSSLTHLHLGDSFDLPITILPSSLISLVFSINCIFDHPITCLPPSLLHLKFNHAFNSSPNPLPDKLQTLKFGDEFNQNLDSLPSELIKLQYGKHYSNFTFPLPNLPPKLVSLRLCTYDHPLPPLPKSLKLLRIEDPYKHPVDASDTSLYHLGADTDILIAPPSLHSMTVTINDTFQPPSSIKNLALLPNSFLSSTIAWPNLTYLDLCDITFGIPFPWPLSLTSLYIDDQSYIPLNNLPSTLKNVSIGSEFDHPIDDLPQSLSKLIIGNDFDQTIDKLPPFLNHLKIGHSFSCSINNLPPTIQYLSVGNAFNHPINNLPSSIETLILGSSFNHPINKLPPSLTTLSIGSSFNQEVTHLPPTLTDLTLPLHSLACGVLPNSISSLNITPIFSDDDDYTLYLPVNLKHFKINMAHFDHDIISFNFASWKMSVLRQEEEEEE